MAGPVPSHPSMVTAMTQTTGGLASEGLLDEELSLALPSLSEDDAITIGRIALDLAIERSLPIAIEVRRCGRVVFRAARTGTSADNDSWVARKARVVERFGRSTLAMRVRYEERATTFHEATGLPASDYVDHGGGLPLLVEGTGMVGVLVISGLPQVDDHRLAVECVREHLRRLG